MALLVCSELLLMAPLCRRKLRPALLESCMHENQLCVSMGERALCTVELVNGRISLIACQLDSLSSCELDIMHMLVRGKPRHL